MLDHCLKISADVLMAQASGGGDLNQASAGGAEGLESAGDGALNFRRVVEIITQGIILGLP